MTDTDPGPAVPLEWKRLLRFRGEEGWCAGPTPNQCVRVAKTPLGCVVLWPFTAEGMVLYNQLVEHGPRALCLDTTTSL